MMSDSNIPPPPPSAPEERPMQPEAQIASWSPFKTSKDRGIHVSRGILIIIGIIIFILSPPLGIIFIVIGVFLKRLKRIVIRGRSEVLYAITNRRAIVYEIKGKQQYELQSCDLYNAKVYVLNRKQISEAKTDGEAVDAEGILGIKENAKKILAFIILVFILFPMSFFIFVDLIPQFLFNHVNHNIFLAFSIVAPLIAIILFIRYVIAVGGVGSAKTVGKTNIGDVIFMVGGIPQVKFIGVKDPDEIAQTVNQVISSLKGT